MSILFILNKTPYDQTDVTWNALRLAEELLNQKQEIRIFLMNDSIDLARESCVLPEGYDQDLKAILKDLISKGVSVEVCGSCMVRCRIHKNEPYYDGANKSTMVKLAEWVISSDKIINF